jgi:phosphomannomutase
MREKHALFAGELSGHYYYRDMGFTDNAVFTMIQMLNFLSLKMTRLSRVIRTIKKYYSTGEINMKVNNKEAVFSALEAQYKDARKDHLDGLTIEYDAWWFNLRASNTEPVMRLNLEADDESTMEERREEVLRIIGDADPSMMIEG